MSQRAWLIAQEISSIRSPYFEKTSKMWSEYDNLGQRQNTAIFVHFLDVFSGQCDRIESIPFALIQAPWDTSLDYPQHMITRTVKFHFFLGWPSFERAPKTFVDEKKCFPDVFLYIGHHIRYLLKLNWTLRGDLHTLLLDVKLLRTNEAACFCKNSVS